MDVKGKNVIVVGLAKSGAAALKLLKKQGAKAKATEISAKGSVACLAEKLSCEGFEIEIGRHTPDFLKGAELIVTSPGVPDTALPIMWARKNRVKVIDEIELAYMFCKSPVIAVTGTNGKSTTVSLIGHIFNKSKRQALICGNIGNPFSGEIENLKDGCVVVLEASSFQLSRIDSFRPKAAVLLNITQNHLDRHADFNEYLRAKMNIFKNQSASDVAVLNYKDENILKNTANIKARKIFFNKDAFDICDVKDLKIKGAHNVENAQAAAACANAFGITQESVAVALKSFEGLEHRCEYFASVNGVRFINDSKSTTVDAAIKALGCCEGPVVLIAGGRDKNSDFTPLRRFLSDKVKAVVLIGEARDKIKNALSGTVDIKEADSLKDAVIIALKSAKSGENILLSPMCTSFDMFENFEHRGEVFKEIVKGLG